MKKLFTALSLLLLIGTWTASAAAQSWSSSGPIPRAYHSAVLDPVTNRMILFGGLPSNTFGQQNLGDVWRLNGAGGTNLTWLRVRPIGPSPRGRFGSSAVYDSSSNRLILFGGAKGRSAPCMNDVWVLTHANGNGAATPAWLQLSPSGIAPAPRTLHGGVYDPNTNTLIVYGGEDCSSTLFADVWVLSNANGVSGTPTWTQLSPAGIGPGPRAIGQSIAYDSINNRLLIFGNGNQPGGTSNDVWVLSNANGSGGTPVWMQLSPAATPPPARAANSAIYDPTTNRLIIFGGIDASGVLLGDAWILSNANGLGGTPQWAQLLSSSLYFPEARAGHTAVYNLSKNKMIVFGGQITPASEGLSTSDVFVLSDANGQ